MEMSSARGLKMLFNFFQHALVARDTILSWLLFKARGDQKDGERCAKVRLLAA